MFQSRKLDWLIFVRGNLIKNKSRNNNGKSKSFNAIEYPPDAVSFEVLFLIVLGRSGWDADGLNSFPGFDISHCQFIRLLICRSVHLPLADNRTNNCFRSTENIEQLWLNQQFLIPILLLFRSPDKYRRFVGIYRAKEIFHLEPDRSIIFSRPPTHYYYFIWNNNIR